VDQLLSACYSATYASRPTSVQRFNAIFRQFVRLLPAFSALFGALWALFSLYAQLGVVIFGGRIRTDTFPAGQEGASLPYALNNFNDFGSGLVTLFELLIVNNWHVITDVFVAATDDWARVYFISWYVLAVVVMSNLIVAHILDGILVDEGPSAEEAPREEHESPTTTPLRAVRPSGGTGVVS
jgi:two pore calcium channel protein